MRPPGPNFSRQIKQIFNVATTFAPCSIPNCWYYRSGQIIVHGRQQPQHKLVALVWHRSFSRSIKLAGKTLDHQQISNDGVDDEPIVNRVPDEQLLSYRENRRWDLSKRLHVSMDNLMQKIATAGQRINTYTGSDYSSIAALRQEIKEQEKLVEARHNAVGLAKAELEASHQQKGSSATELVALLERKHSWSSTDLERYMSLVRSEHANDQAVQIAKDKVASVEKALEESRTRLEKRERAQYHEEQIWSDTIRRNSTWVTIGLMGVNIVLLLANLVIFEPWRRGRLVREMRLALNDKMILPAPLSVIAEPLEDMHAKDMIAATDDDLPAPDHAGLKIAEPDFVTRKVVVNASSTEPEVYAAWTIKDMKEFVRSLFSNHAIVIRRVDLTIVAIQATITGAALAIWSAYILWRAR